ncbi:uncharacterized protein V1518DRAFT_303288 [Limtongia smithiae]|uniref:uncharacterized protein n=1 Tax=Limtongia smithiae TaxID=1125753 RepID=UPI0034CD5F27
MLSPQDVTRSTYAFISHSPATYLLHQPDIDNPPLARRKRRRTSPNELRILYSEFNRCPKPHRQLRKEIAERVGMSEKAVQIWFQNRRQSSRRAAVAEKTARKASAEQHTDDMDVDTGDENHKEDANPDVAAASVGATAAAGKCAVASDDEDDAPAAALPPSPTPHRTARQAASSVTPPAAQMYLFLPEVPLLRPPTGAAATPSPALAPSSPPASLLQYHTPAPEQFAPLAIPPPPILSRTESMSSTSSKGVLTPTSLSFTNSISSGTPLPSFASSYAATKTLPPLPLQPPSSASALPLRSTSEVALPSSRYDISLPPLSPPASSSSSAVSATFSTPASSSPCPNVVLPPFSELRTALSNTALSPLIASSPFAPAARSSASAAMSQVRLTMSLDGRAEVVFGKPTIAVDAVALDPSAPATVESEFECVQNLLQLRSGRWA